MEFKKYLIIASKKDVAGVNITTQLSQFGDFSFYLVEEDIIHTENLDLEKINQFDFVIFASKHCSEKKKKSTTLSAPKSTQSLGKEKTISIHAPGNWNKAEFGGEENKICPTSAMFQKQLFEKLHENSEKYHLKDYKLTLECTHHGPLIDKPCIFVEIGATENEWKNRKAGFIVAKSLSEIMNSFKENQYNEVAIGIGGPHYCPNFNKIQLKSNVAISHVIPQYALPVTEEMIKQAWNKTEEEVDFAVLDWKGLGNSEQRQQVLEILDKLYIRWKKIGEISK